MSNRLLVGCFSLALLSMPCCLAQLPEVDTARGDSMLGEYFDAETKRLTDRCLSEIKTLEDWHGRRELYRTQLLEMLGLDPFPTRSSLDPVVTGTVEKDGLIVEKLHFQSLPGLYVTANFYRPAQQDEALPAILYVCGHAGAKKDGVSYGNKTHYQHHGAWFARNGYVCLIIDTIQLGEIEGIHHGTYREGMWWWNNRGYTPAGVEAWNCIRALDYLETRVEVDQEKLGVTGRSGGGAYSWWTAAIDDRIKVAVPVAGITSLENHVVDGCVAGHCDCMFMVNTYRWDYPMVAALVAPRPLLISNSDKDRIFPLEGVLDVHAKVRRIYELHDAGDRLGLQITEGPHRDTQELRVHAFRWFNRFLKQSDDLIQSPATPFFEQEDLRVFEELPSDQRVTTIHETFVPAVPLDSLPVSRRELNESGRKVMQSLVEKTFRGWPSSEVPPSIDQSTNLTEQGFRLRVIDYTSQSPFKLRMYVLTRDCSSPKRLLVRVLTDADWESSVMALAVAFSSQFPEAKPNEAMWSELNNQLGDTALVLVLPRGIGPTQWTRDEPKQTHIRRRFMQLGQTLAGMQTFDVVRALQLIRSLDGLPREHLQMSATGEAANWALFASLWVDDLDQLDLADLPASNFDSPDLLNVSRFVELPEIAMLAASRVGELTLEHSQVEQQEAWQAIRQSHPLVDELIQFETADETSAASDVSHAAK